MNITIKPNLSATITIGKQIGYTTSSYKKEKLIAAIKQFQRHQISERGVYLSACISECEIVLSGQAEPHFKFDFINYPKFPLEEIQFISEVELLAVYLMDKFSQNRLVIVFHNETRMLKKRMKLIQEFKIIQ